MRFGRPRDFEKYCKTTKFTRYPIGVKWSQVKSCQPDTVSPTEGNGL